MGYLGLTVWQEAGNEMCISEEKVSWPCRCFTPMEMVTGCVEKSHCVHAWEDCHKGR